ncbi:amino-acid N-acetyltransferase subunit Mak10 [Sporothrix schenckii 1099-18]|uniref:Amino-acid N-acetyltransferase subunit Mak10 n=1 Tax=Sporothrix schenckii 1099-18 TaxID=1397361 RepID=A0A0F2M8I4_SPOSC|nr:amino-acid N-acetyltransferase subunit Mak10 [Sporothrix schenckii 1099-18]KJR85419.1 amino-acid N-acetyltransferase subunit Mak10 [Sporothrix schenckii 1099-18]
MASDAARDALRLPREEAVVNQGLEGLSLTPNSGSPPRSPPPPASSSTRITSNGVVSIDITSRFTAAASTLEPGDIVKDGYFTLFESVGALEIMDPKMDSGCVSAEELVDNDHQQLMRSLLPAEVVGIIDQLLCLEMAWHLGYPLSQTLLTSIYMTGILNPPPRTLNEADYMRRQSAEGTTRSPAHAVLRAYCIAVIKTVGDIITSFKSEVYYEEEDIATNTYHLSLLEDVGRDEIRQVLQEARTAIVEVGDAWADTVSLALEARLDFRETFLTAIELAELRIRPDALKVPWTQMTDAVKNIKESHDLGIAVPAAFNTKMQGLLASTMPPRPIVQPSFEDAVEQWSRFSTDGAEAMGILAYEDPQSLLNFVLTFQAKKPQPLAYIRVLMQSFIFAENIMLGEHSIRQIMDDDLSIVVLPANILLDPINDEIEVARDPRFALAKHMEEFRIRSFPAYLEIFRTLCQNRSRARRMMCHILHEWERVQMDAEEIDNLVESTLNEIPENSLLAGTGPGDKPLPLSSWAFLYKIRLMEWVVQLGFELEIYQADELAGMYWYLSYLAKRRVMHCERIRAFTLRSHGEMRQRGGGRALPGDQEAVMTKSLTFLRTMMLDASVTWELADALSCLYAALHRTGLLKTPVRPYSTDELRYELRMRPFAAIGLPALPSFETFQKEAQQSTSTIKAILDYAEKALGGAKKGCEALTRFTEAEAFSAHHHERWLSGTKGMHKSAIFAGLAVASLKREVVRVEMDARSVGNGLESDVGAAALKLTAQVPKPDKCYHEWWIVPKVASATSS